MVHTRMWELSLDVYKRQGIANAYYDSIPTMFLTGQVDTYAKRGRYPVRQRGFQETEVISMVKDTVSYTHLDVYKRQVFDEPLADEGRSIIASWNSAVLTAEQQEAVNEFWNVVDNPYPWEELEE